MQSHGLVNGNRPTVAGVFIRRQLWISPGITGITGITAWKYLWKRLKRSHLKRPLPSAMMTMMGKMGMIAKAAAVVVAVAATAAFLLLQRHQHLLRMIEKVAVECGSMGGRYCPLRN